MRGHLSVLGAMLLMPMALHAQANVDSVHNRNDCRLARQVVETGNPRTRTDWGWKTLVKCGREGAAAWTGGWQRLRTSRDTVLLRQRSKAAWGFLDEQILQAAVVAGSDASASNAYRVISVAVVLQQLKPWLTWSYGELVENDGACRTSFVNHYSVSGTPLTAASQQRARDALSALHAQADTPAEVRNAVGCVLLMIGS